MVKIEYKEKKKLVKVILGIINGVVDDSLTSQKLDVLSYIMINGDKSIVQRSNERKEMCKDLSLSTPRLSLILKELSDNRWLVDNEINSNLKHLMTLLNKDGVVHLNFELKLTV